ncbi:MAG TPA: substrate-binding domain-containing protein [Aggregatilineaceae bacterium]|nr:substrate-binding domain-containing protein [Aggregatilineaceae bacterium]
MKRAKQTIVILSLALASCRGPTYTPTATPEVLSVRMLASSSTYPLLQELAEGYDQPGILLTVHSTSTSWDKMMIQLAAGEYALTTYYPSDQALWIAPIGQDGLAVIVHPSNGVPALSLEDLRLIFQGRVVNWGEVGGPDVPIQVISREEASDTRLLLDERVMGGRQTTLAARLALSDDRMVEAVATTPGAVGYISVGQINTQVRVVPLMSEAGQDPVAPNADTLRAQLYPLSNPVVIVGVQAPAADSAYGQWFGWMQSEAGQQIVARHYTPLAK